MHQVLLLFTRRRRAFVLTQFLHHFFPLGTFSAGCPAGQSGVSGRMDELRLSTSCSLTSNQHLQFFFVHLVTPSIGPTNTFDWTHYTTFLFLDHQDQFFVDPSPTPFFNQFLFLAQNQKGSVSPISDLYSTNPKPQISQPHTQVMASKKNISKRKESAYCYLTSSSHFRSPLHGRAVAAIHLTFPANAIIDKYKYKYKWHGGMTGAIHSTFPANAIIGKAILPPPSTQRQTLRRANFQKRKKCLII